jgi:hypothetical protein
MHHPSTAEQMYVYRWNRMDRKGQRCRIVARGKMNTVQIEFEDGFIAFVSGNSLRKAPVCHAS